MANPVIIPKKSVVAQKVPTSSDLALGEICINHADAKLYARHPSSGAIQEIGSLAAHSHDQLISIDSTADLELQNDGSVIITDGSTPTTLAVSSTTSRTITFPDKSGTVAFLDDVGGISESDSYSEPTYTNGILTALTTWSDNTKSVLVQTKTFAYTDGNLTSVIVTDNNGLTTLTKTLTYAGDNLASVTKDFA